MPNTPFRTEEERRVTLTRREHQALLSIDASFQSISKAVYFDNYDLPCPVRVCIRTKHRSVVTVVLRKTRHGDVRKEVKVLQALQEFGLAVPAVLLAPFETEDSAYAAVYSLLPGENLQALSTRSEESLAMAKNLLVRAVIRLMAATQFLQRHEVSNTLERITLMDELQSLDTNENPWRDEPSHKSAIEILRKILPRIETPLVLSNGDYQPGNFLAEDGKITGYLDFESTSFQDPLMGFVKYPIYDVYPLARTDLVKTFLDANGYSEQDFEVRLILGCLKTLKREIPVSGGTEEVRRYRDRVLGLLKDACALASPA